MKKLVILVAILLTLLPFFHAGLFDVHDPTSAFRLYTLVQSLRFGQFPAAWSNLLNFGYGYPLHLFYAPLFTYLGAIFVPFIGSYEIAVKLSLLVASLVGTIGIYRLLRCYGVYPALLGAVAFTFLPYRASALYVRGSYAEFLAMSLLPWVLYYWMKPQSNKKTILSTAVITALFTLSHNTLIILTVPIILLLILLYQTKNVRGSLLTLIGTFGLTAWFILPIIFERNFVQVDMIARLTDYRDHFLAISQLWFSPWGYGGSAKGVAADHMSFMIGKGQLILSFLGLVGLSLARRWKLLILYFVIVFFAVFITLPQSLFIWQTFSFLSVMQFPWRALALVGVGVAALSGLSLAILPPKLQPWLCLVLAIALVYTNFTYFRPQEYRDYTKNILSSSTNLDPLVRDKIPEYLPVWMPSFPANRGDDGLTHTPVSVYGRLTTHDTTPLVIGTAYMPQWQMKLNGQYQPIEPSSTGLVKTVNDVHAGDNNITLTWHRTVLENLSLAISTFSLFAVVGLLIL